jgi:GNAT superfamily N-acetyltransferase
MLEAHVKTFPDGQWVAVRERDGEIVGSSTSLRVRLWDAVKQHTWKEITGGGYLTTHRPDGDALYGTEIMVHPDSRRMGIAKRLYEARKVYVVSQRLKAFVTGGRIPGFDAYADRLDARQYVALVVAGEIEDRVLTPQLRSGLVVAGVLDAYLVDPKSRGHASLLLWRPGPKPRPAPTKLDTIGHD